MTRRRISRCGLLSLFLAVLLAGIAVPALPVAAAPPHVPRCADGGVTRPARFCTITLPTGILRPTTAMTIGQAANVTTGGTGRTAPIRTANTVHVTKCFDQSGVLSGGTLRGQINAAQPGDTIVFDQDCTTTLTVGPLVLTKNVTIDGTGHTVVVDGNHRFLPFLVGVGVTASLTALTIRNGKAADCGAGSTCGGAIVNGGTLTVTSCTLSGNTATAGLGGAIMNGDTLTVTNSTLSSNSASSGGAIMNGGTLTVTGSTFSSNTATYDASSQSGGLGGAIANSAGTATVTNSILTGNHADQGGGIDNGSTLTVTGSTLTANTATFDTSARVGGLGGAIANSTGTLTVTGSTLAGNTAVYDATSQSGGLGGAIVNGGTLTVMSSTLTGNNAGYGFGGSISILAGTATVTDSTLSSNSATLGGGIANSGALTVTRSTLSGNTATDDASSGTPGFGGGILNQGGLTVTSSTLSGNSASDGGGVANVGTLTLTNSTLSGNSVVDSSGGGTDGFGGGILNTDSNALHGTATVTNSTLSGNSAASAGGIGNGDAANGDMVTVTNTIVAANTTTGTGPDLFGPITTGGHNLFGTTSGATITLGSGDLVNPTPLLGPLGNIGGPTQTVPLLPGSPAIDAGFDAICIDTGIGKVNRLDQRGIARPQGPHCDIGAFEIQPGPTSISPASGATAGGNTVTLTGAGFGTTANTQVIMDGVALPAASVTGATGTQIVFVAPAHTVGNVTITVRVYGSPLLGTVTYTYGTLTPPALKPTGGTGEAAGSPGPVPGTRPAGNPVGNPSPLPAGRP